MAFYNCLLIDSDATLLDFDSAEETAFFATMRAFSLPDTLHELELYREINNDLWAQVERGKIKQEKLLSERFRLFLQKIGAKGEGQKINTVYLDNLSLGSDMLPGADEALIELAEVATIGIVTNGLERVQRARFSASGIEKLVDGIFISERMGVAKPARKIFDGALTWLGVENRKKVLVVGDSLSSDIKGGQNAGLDTCWCNFKDIENTTNIKPKYTVRGFEELLRVVMEQEELDNVGSSEKRHIV